MTDPYLVPCLVELRAEFNVEAPNRDKGADGWIGDIKHQGEVSDHNPRPDGKVLALDIDSTGPWPKPFDDYVNFIISECQAGREIRIEYIIRNRKIYERKNGYKGRTYTGVDPHTNHAHFSARHDLSGYNNKGEWFMLSNADFSDLSDLIDARLRAWSELDPLSTTNPQGSGRVGGWIRTIEMRRQAMEKTLVTKLDAIVTALSK